MVIKFRPKRKSKICARTKVYDLSRYRYVKRSMLPVKRIVVDYNILPLYLVMLEAYYR